jgi:tetratricopeptide (TPR) repeat protein
MSRGLFKDIRTFTKNITRHTGYVLRGRESVGDAFSGVASDAKKLRKHAGKKHSSDRRKEATKLLKQGREAYNSKNDTLAEKCFREAVLADETYALAYAYLGNALYRQGRTEEAEHNWHRATMVDPGSEGASKALRSLQRLAKQKKAFIDRLDDKLRNDRKS